MEVAQDTGRSKPHKNNLSTNDPPPLRDIDAEQGLLGLLLERPNRLAELHWFRTDYFDEPLHSLIYDQLLKLVSAGGKVDVGALKSWAETQPSFEAGGRTLTIYQYLQRMVAYAPVGLSVHGYAEAVRDCWMRRQLQGIGQDIADGLGRGVEIPVIVRHVQDLAFDLSEQGNVRNTRVSIAEAMGRAIDAFNTAHQNGGKIPGVSTGLVDLDERIGGLGNSNLIVLAGRPAMGKALKSTEPVLLADGTWRAIGDLRVGDRLASVDGAPSVVLGVYPQGRKQLYRVTFKDGRSVECCDEHLWSVKYRDWNKPRVLKTSRLVEMLECTKYIKRLSIDLVSGDFGADVDLPLDGYVLGSLIANGGLTGAMPRLTTPFENVMETVAKAVAELRVNPGARHRLTTSLVSAERRTNAVRDALDRLGLWGLRSEEKFIPPAYLSATRSTRAALLQGLMDGDGWVEKFGAMRYGTSSLRLARDVQTLVRSLGGLATVRPRSPKYTYKGEKLDGKPAWVVNITFRDGSPYVSVPLRAERVRPMRSAYLSVASIKPTDVDEAVCITVSHPAALYITRDYIVTHNTALAGTITKAAARSGKSVLFFSQEMSADQLAARMISEETEINSEKLTRGRFSQDEFRQAYEAADRLGRLPIVFDETGGITAAQIALQARRAALSKRLDLIVIDYLQLMGSERRAENRTQELTKITMALTALAKALNVPVLLLSQLSREVEKRSDKRPQLSDLRESGSIEQDADLVLFVYRDDYYLSREQPSEDDLDAYSAWQQKMHDAAGTAEVIVAKNRHGATGIVKLAFDADRTRFADLARGGDHARA